MKFDIKVFGKRLLELRTERGLSSRQLSQKVSIGRSAIIAWENGQRTPLAHNIFELAKFFGVSADYLLGLTDY